MSVTLLRGGGGDRRLTEAVLLTLRELRRRLRRVLPWSQLQRDNVAIHQSPSRHAAGNLAPPNGDVGV